MTHTYVATGALTDGTTVKLDEPLPVAAGRVKVTVEIVAAAVQAGPNESLQDFLDRVHGERAAAGVQPLTAEQIDEWADDIRNARG